MPVESERIKTKTISKIKRKIYQKARRTQLRNLV